MSIFINNLIDVGDKRTLWIDADNKASIAINLIYINTNLIVTKKETINAHYADNYLWKASIPTIMQEGVVLGKVSVKEDDKIFNNSFILKTLGAKNIFIYTDTSNGSSIPEALQLNNKAEIIDEIKMIHIQYDFFVGKINKIEQSLICVDNVCTVFLNKDYSESSNNNDVSNNKTMLKELALLKRQLEECANAKSSIILNHNAALSSNTINHPITLSQANTLETKISSSTIKTTNSSKVNIKNNTSTITTKKR